MTKNSKNQGSQCKLIATFKKKAGEPGTKKMVKNKCYIFQNQQDCFPLKRGQQFISVNLNNFFIGNSKKVKRSNHIRHNLSINSLNRKCLQYYILMIGLSYNFTIQFGHHISQNNHRLIEWFGLVWTLMVI